MSADKLDMSLEDIIKMNKQGGQRNNVGRSLKLSSPGSRLRSREGNGGSKIFGVSGGGVQRRENRSSTFQKDKNLPDQWQHDLFEDLDLPVRRQGFNVRKQYSNDKHGTLLISNLHFGVNDMDIKELFGECGPLTKAEVHYDRSGRSLGTAEVVFKNSSDAVQAMKQYNNVPLDGQPMKLTVINNSGETRSVTSRLGPSHSSRDDSYKPQKQGDEMRSTTQGRGRFGNLARRGGRRDQNIPTREELDAQLDAYNCKMDAD